MRNRQRQSPQAIFQRVFKPWADFYAGKPHQDIDYADKAETLLNLIRHQMIPAIQNLSNPLKGLLKEMERLMVAMADFHNIELPNKPNTDDLTLNAEVAYRHYLLGVANACLTMKRSALEKSLQHHLTSEVQQTDGHKDTAEHSEKSLVHDDRETYRQKTDYSYRGKSWGVSPKADTADFKSLIKALSDAKFNKTNSDGILELQIICTKHKNNPKKLIQKLRAEAKYRTQGYLGIVSFLSNFKGPMMKGRHANIQTLYEKLAALPDEPTQSEINGIVDFINDGDNQFVHKSTSAPQHRR